MVSKLQRIYAHKNLNTKRHVCVCLLHISDDPNFFLIWHQEEESGKFGYPLKRWARHSVFCYVETMKKQKKTISFPAGYPRLQITLKYIKHTSLYLKECRGLTNLKKIWWSSVAKEVKSRESGKRIPPTRDKIRTFFLRHKFTTKGENTLDTDHDTGPNQSVER